MDNDVGCLRCSLETVGADDIRPYEGKCGLDVVGVGVLDDPFGGQSGGLSLRKTWKDTTGRQVMKKIKFDSGMEEYRLGGGVLRFHPGDPNLYARLTQAEEKLVDIEKKLVEDAKDQGADPIRLLHAADREMKQVLGWVFGPGNDFDVLLEGVNLLAVGANGERVVTNLFAALQDILEAGVERCARQAAGK